MLVALFIFVVNNAYAPSEVLGVGMKTGKMSEAEERLIKGLCDGDRKIFEEIFQEYYAPLIRMVQRYTNDSVVAEEIVQDMFCKIWTKHSELIITKSLKSYLYRSVKNHCLNYIKHEKIRLQYQQFIGFSVRGEQTFIDGVVNKEIKLKLGEALLNLPDRRREIFELSRFEGMKYTDIAKRLNLSVKTVESQMSKALNDLRIALKDFMY